MHMLIKKYLCVVCSKKEIIESIIEHTLEGDVPDISNCDFSTYSDHIVINGKLLANRPELNWKNLYFKSYSELPISEAPGGICNDCLRGNQTVATLAGNKHINFADENNLKN